MGAVYAGGRADRDGQNAPDPRAYAITWAPGGGRRAVWSSANAFAAGRRNASNGRQWPPGGCGGAGGVGAQFSARGASGVRTSQERGIRTSEGGRAGDGEAGVGGCSTSGGVTGVPGLVTVYEQARGLKAGGRAPLSRIARKTRKVNEIVSFLAGTRVLLSGCVCL